MDADMAGNSDANRQLATTILFPIVACFRAMGLSEGDVDQILVSLYRKQSRRQMRRMERIEGFERPIYHFRELIARWIRDERYIDDRGRPRNLLFGGRNGLASLIKESNTNVSPKKAVETLVRYGTIKRIGRGSYALVRPFFCISTPDNLAFEPFAHFLADAGSTLERIFRTSTRTMYDKGAFWRKVENRTIPLAAEKEFMLFARERSQIFFEEVDEWLTAHSQRKRSRGVRRKVRRVGLGLFSISSDINTW